MSSGSSYFAILILPPELVYFRLCRFNQFKIKIYFVTLYNIHVSVSLQIFLNKISTLTDGGEYGPFFSLILHIIIWYIILFSN